MLVLARKCGEAIVIPELNVVFTILEKQGDRIRIGVEAPRNLTVHRREVWERMQEEQDLHSESAAVSSSNSSPVHS